MNTIIKANNGSKIHLTPDNFSGIQSDVLIKKIVIEPDRRKQSLELEITFKLINTFENKNFLGQLLIGQNNIYSDMFIKIFKFDFYYPYFQLENDKELQIQNINSIYDDDDILIICCDVHVKQIDSKVYLQLKNLKLIPIENKTLFNDISDDIKKRINNMMFNNDIDTCANVLSAISKENIKMLNEMKLRNTNKINNLIGFNHDVLNNKAVINRFSALYSLNPITDFFSCEIEVYLCSISLNNKKIEIFQNDLLDSVYYKNEFENTFYIYLPLMLANTLFIRVKNSDVNTVFLTDNNQRYDDIVGAMTVKEGLAKTIDFDVSTMFPFSLKYNTYFEFMTEHEEILDFKSCLIIYSIN